MDCQPNPPSIGVELELITGIHDTLTGQVSLVASQRSSLGQVRR